MTPDATRLDPRAKQHIKDRLYRYLYDPVYRKLHERLKAMIVANSRALASSQTGFMYRNEWYTLEPDQIPPRLKNRLIEGLRPQMEEFLHERDRLTNYELPYTLGFVNKVLNQSDRMADYLRMFPEPVHAALQGMEDLAPGEPQLSDDQVMTVRCSNETAIELIKSRLVLNLLLQ